MVDGKNQYVSIGDWQGQISGQVSLPEVADGLVVQGTLTLNGSSIDVCTFICFYISVNVSLVELRRANELDNQQRDYKSKHILGCPLCLHWWKDVAS